MTIRDSGPLGRRLALTLGIGVGAWMLWNPIGGERAADRDRAGAPERTPTARAVGPTAAAPIALREPPAVRTAATVDAADRSAVATLVGAYRTDEIIVAPAPGTTLEQIADQAGVDIVRAVGRAGYGAIGVPAGMPVGRFLHELRATGQVTGAAPNGITKAAGDPMSSAAATEWVSQAEALVAARTAAVTAQQDVLAAAEAAHQQSLVDEETAEANLEAAKDADADDATEDALKDVLEEKKDARDDARQARDQAAGDLRDLQGDLEDAQDDLADAQEELSDAEAFETAQAIAAEHARLDKIRKVQWFLKRSGHPKWKLTDRSKRDQVEVPDLSEWTVAVLDSGVAYEDHADASGTYIAAGSLAGSAIVAPWDFVNNDAHANDDHQHGTHIASIIASDGDIQGLAPSVGLMPLKVLDADNHGTELDLVDAIWHAIDNGADVINMSLSFDVAYMPSQPLQEALDAAAQAGIVMVAAAGNDGSGIVTWPAASPQVVAIGSGTPKSKDGKLKAATYSNLSNGIALTAAGGTVDGDENEDGFSDGILAETIALNDPTETGWWFYAGTSQAAALVSGAAVHLLDAGASPIEARNALQYGADDGAIDGDAFVSGFGAGVLDLAESTKALEEHPEDLQAQGTYHVAMMPYLRWKRVEEYDDNGKWKCKEREKWKSKLGDKIEPSVLFTVFDDSGQPVKDVEVMGLMWGTKEGVFKCKTKDNGTCIVKGKSINPEVYDDPEAEMEVAQAWQVEALVKNRVAQLPGSMVFATDGFEVLVGAARSESALDDGLLAFHADQSCAREEIGEVAEAYSVVNSGTGLASSPLGISFTPPMIENNATVTTVNVDLDGTGLASSPLGFTQFRMIAFDMDGTGLASSPLGLTQLRLVAFEGTGLASSPLGFHMMNVFTPMSGTGLASSPLGFDSNPILMTSGVALGVDITGSSIGDQLAENGWTAENGGLAATLLAGTGLVGIDPPEGIFGSGLDEGAGSEEVDPAAIEAAD